LSGVSSEVSIIDPETLVSLSSRTGLVEGVWFVHSVEQVSIGILSNSSGSVIGDGIGGSSISDQEGGISVRGRAHVLEEDVTDQFRVDSTSMLSSPLNGEERTFIERHSRSVTESSLRVVLRVEESIGVISVGVGFVQPIVTSSRILHIHIGVDYCQKGEKDDGGSHFH
jgi:hypothetical protein